jgi:hypothetical protein
MEYVDSPELADGDFTGEGDEHLVGEEGRKEIVVGENAGVVDDGECDSYEGGWGETGDGHCAVGYLGVVAVEIGKEEICVGFHCAWIVDGVKGEGEGRGGGRRDQVGYCEVAACRYAGNSACTVGESEGGSGK